MINAEAADPAGWVPLMIAERDVVPATSSLTRRSAAAVIGLSAVGWAVDVADLIAAQLKDQVPDWPTDHSDDELQVLRQSIEATILQALVALVDDRRSELTTTPEAVEFVRYYVRRGISGDHVTNSVHVAQSLFTLAIIRAIDQLVPSADNMAVVLAATRRIAELWDRFAHTVAVTYADERDRWTRSEMGLRLQVVERVMSAARISEDEASRRLGYQLNVRHVGSVLRIDTDIATRSLDVAAIARRLAADAGCVAAPLILQRGHARADVWFPDPAIGVDEVAQATSWPAGVLLSLGEPAHGVAGFRTTYRQAGATCRVARLREKGDKVTRYRDVRLVSLLAAEMDRAIGMARETLGPLAEDDPKMEVLRETLHAHHAQGQNVNATAKAIHSHRNTVTYRLRQVEALLPGPAADPEVACALLIVENFPHLVLVPASGER